MGQEKRSTQEKRALSLLIRPGGLSRPTFIRKICEKHKWKGRVEDRCPGCDRDREWRKAVAVALLIEVACVLWAIFEFNQR